MPSHEETIHNLAVNAFKDHKIEVRFENGMYRHYRCASPGTGVYHFNVYTVPGRLFVSGDIGDLMLARTEDMLVWARGAVGSIGYFAEKVPSSMPTREFSQEVAKRKVQQEIDDLNGLLSEKCDWCNGTGLFDSTGCSGDDEEECNSCDGTGDNYVGTKRASIKAKIGNLKGIRFDEADERQMHEAWYDATGEHDDLDFRDYTSNFLWCREAMMWFFSNSEYGK